MRLRHERSLVLVQEQRLQLVGFQLIYAALRAGTETSGTAPPSTGTSIADGTVRVISCRWYTTALSTASWPHIPNGEYPAHRRRGQTHPRFGCRPTPLPHPE
jgi:hypothetical protein